jgi:hypothetical protein
VQNAGELVRLLDGRCVPALINKNPLGVRDVVAELLGDEGWSN